MIWSEESGGRFSLVEHPIPPRTLAASLYRQTNEDEYGYVEGRMGAKLGDEVVYAEAGNLVFKPRYQRHTFWNAGDGPCRILEIISPGGFEHLFEEAVGHPEAMAGEPVPALDARYGLEFDYDSAGRLREEHGLRFPNEWCGSPDRKDARRARSRSIASPLSDCSPTAGSPIRYYTIYP